MRWTYQCDLNEAVNEKARKILARVACAVFYFPSLMKLVKKANGPNYSSNNRLLSSLYSEKLQQRIKVYGRIWNIREVGRHILFTSPMKNDFLHFIYDLEDAIVNCQWSIMQAYELRRDIITWRDGDKKKLSKALRKGERDLREKEVFEENLTVSGKWLSRHGESLQIHGAGLKVLSCWMESLA